MSIISARNGRRRALAMRSANKRLVEPAERLDEVVLPEKGSFDAGLLKLLSKGISIDLLSQRSGWPASEVLVQVFRVVKRASLGLERQDGELRLVYPDVRVAGGCDMPEVHPAAIAQAQAEPMQAIAS